MKRKIIITGIILLIVGLIAWKLAANKKTLNEKKQPVNTTVAIPVKATPVKYDTISLAIQKTGDISAFKTAKVLAAAAGNITQLRFDLGDHVSEGQLLAITDHQALQIDLEKAQTNVAKLRNDLATYTELLAGKATTEQKVKDLQQNYNDALSQESRLRRQIADAYIKAPISGDIQTKDVESGVFVNAGAQVATIVNVAKLKVQVRLTESEVYMIKQGQAVNISADVYPSHIFHGSVTFISPAADEAHNYLTEITLNNDPAYLLRPGTFVKANFSASIRRTALLVPGQAIIGGMDNAAVYVAANGHAKLQAVRTGQQLNGMVEITEGLTPGQQVIVSGQINLSEGAPIHLSK